MSAGDIKTIELTFVNAFLVKVKDGFVLIDTGLAEHWDRLQKELESAGCTPGTLKLVILTHGDRDHAGNCAKLQAIYKCRIAMHQGDAAMVENGIVPKRTVRTLAAKFFVFLRKLRKRELTFNKFKPDIFLTDGQSLNEYGFNATVVHIPGHTKGSIGIVTDDGNLFSGDMLTNTRRPDTAVYIENSRDLENSLSRLKKMKIITVYPGHGKPFLMKLLWPS